MKQIKCNIHFWNVFNVAIIAVLIDYFVYTININYEIGLLIAVLIVSILNIFLIKKKIFDLKFDFEKLDILFLVIVLGITFSNIAIPDYTYDVANYHIYLQENINIDKINFDFFAGRTLNSFLFALGDRMFYIFRYTLGYRIGTILSYYCLIVIFYQIKNIIKEMYKNKKIISIVSMIFLLSSMILWQIGKYYIDLLGTVFVLQILYYVLKEENLMKNEILMYFVTMLAGIATAIKIINIYFIFPLIIYCLIMGIKNKNLIKFYHFPILIIIFILPFLIYIFDNFKQTGSIIYPYYNNIMKSKYFGEFAWKDEKFGIENIFLTLIWPIYTSVIKLGYGDDWIIFDVLWAIGYIVNIIYVLSTIIKKETTKNKLFILSCISLFFTAIWIIFLEGYMRYGLVIPILYSIIIGTVIVIKLDSKKIAEKDQKLLINIIIIIGSIIVFFEVLLNSDINNLKNYSLILKDRDEVKIHINGVWGVVCNDSALTEIVREAGTPIYNLDFDTNLFDSCDILENMYYNKIKDKKIYVLQLSNDFREKKKILEKNNFEVKLIKTYTAKKIPQIFIGEKLYLYEIKY